MDHASTLLNKTRQTRSLAVTLASLQETTLDPAPTVSGNLEPDVRESPQSGSRQLTHSVWFAVPLAAGFKLMVGASRLRRGCFVHWPGPLLRPIYPFILRATGLFRPTTGPYITCVNAVRPPGPPHACTLLTDWRTPHLSEQHTRPLPCPVLPCGPLFPSTERRRALDRPACSWHPSPSVLSTTHQPLLERERARARLDVRLGRLVWRRERPEAKSWGDNLSNRWATTPFSSSSPRQTPPLPPKSNGAARASTVTVF